MNELPHLRQGLVIGLNDKPIIEMFNGYVHMVWARCEASHHEHGARGKGHFPEALLQRKQFPLN